MTTPAKPSNATGLDECRLAFEKLMTDKAINIDMENDGWGRPRYKHSHVDSMWFGFKAAWNSKPAVTRVVKEE